jgi:hypothetical protein
MKPICAKVLPVGKEAVPLCATVRAALAGAFIG